MADGIKLFGKRIPMVAGDDKDSCEETTSAEVNDSTSVLDEINQGEPNISSSTNNEIEDNQKLSTDDDKLAVDPSTDQDHNETDASDQGTVLKKPDKILPCPRCNSMDTKFCYYNNYNVNQPRHFCKNCQRYWTAGGTMRNVPVGAGRRKNKHSASQYRQIVMPSDGLVANRIIVPDSSHQALPGLLAPTRSLVGNGNGNGTGTVLKFGPEAPLCESMASVLNLREQKRNSEFNPVTSGDNMEEPSCASSVAASNCVENGLPRVPVQAEQNGNQAYCNGATPIHPMQCYSGSPWPYWGPGWNNVAATQGSEFAYGQENCRPSAIPWSGPPPMMAAPAFCGPAIPFPFMPAPFWGCMPGWTNGAWNVPWAGPNAGLSPTPSTSNSGSGGGSTTLGKHSRDASSLDEEKTQKSLWVPKTLRIDDPDEAAKSSIWATLGIKPNEGGMFRDFRPKSQSKGQSPDSQVLHANPAALSRFQSFQEST